MLIVLHPAYTFEVVIHDRELPAGGTEISGAALQNARLMRHKFSDEAASKIGCDEALAAIKKALADAELVADVRLTKFDHQA